MQIDHWLTAASSLVGALIGAGAALAAAYMQLRRSRKAESERERKLAIEEVLVRAVAIDFQAHNMALLASNAGSLDGLLARVLGSVAPVDYAAMFDKLSAEGNALNRAAAQVWLFGEDKTVRLTNAVVLAATDVVTAHTSGGRGWLGTRLMVAFSGHHAGDTKRIAEARRKLAEARRALVEHARRTLGVEHVDLFALPWQEG